MWGRTWDGSAEKLLLRRPLVVPCVVHLPRGLLGLARPRSCLACTFCMGRVRGSSARRLKSASSTTSAMSPGNAPWALPHSTHQRQLQQPSLSLAGCFFPWSGVYSTGRARLLYRLRRLLLSLVLPLSVPGLAPAATPWLPSGSGLWQHACSFWRVCVPWQAQVLAGVGGRPGPAPVQFHICPTQRRGRAVP